MKKIKFILPLFAALLAVGCSGKAGEKGADGAPGAAGSQGQKGDQGSQGEPGQGVTVAGAETYVKKADVTTYGIVHKQYLGVIKARTNTKGKLGYVKLEEIQIMHTWATDGTSNQGVGTLKLSKVIKVGETYFQLTGKAATTTGSTYTLGVGETNYGVIEYTEATKGGTEGSPTFTLVATSPKKLNLANLNNNTDGVSELYAEAAIAGQLFKVAADGTETAAADQCKSTNGYWSGANRHLGWKGNTANFENTIYNYGFGLLETAVKNYKQVVTGDSTEGFTSANFFTLDIGGGVLVNTGCTWDDFAEYAAVALKAYALIEEDNDIAYYNHIVSSFPDAITEDNVVKYYAKVVEYSERYNALPAADKVAANVTKLANLMEDLEDYGTDVDATGANMGGDRVVGDEYKIPVTVTFDDDGTILNIAWNTVWNATTNKYATAQRYADTFLDGIDTTISGSSGLNGLIGLNAVAVSKATPAKSMTISGRAIALSAGATQTGLNFMSSVVAACDKFSSDTVIAQIKALPLPAEILTATEVELVDAAEAAYGALSTAAKALVDADGAGATKALLTAAIEAAAEVVVE